MMSKEVTIYRPDGVRIDVGRDVKWEGYTYRSLMGVSSLQLTLESDTPIDFPLGSYIEEEGHRYTLYYPSSITKRHTMSFEYRLLFHGVEEELKLFKLKDVSGGKPYRLKFFLTAKPLDFLRVVVDTLNLSDKGWSVGDCIDSGEKTLAFNHEDCLSALSRVAEEFHTEWHIEGKRISLDKVSNFADDPLPMQYGMGNGFRSGVGRRNDADRQPIGKLYVEGGNRNIDRTKYGSPTLLLPKNATLTYEGKTYQTDPDGLYITSEGNHYPAEESFDGSGVYPMREGTVTEVVAVKEGKTTFYDIKDSSIPDTLNFDDYRIAGEKATLVFQTGALAGRAFDLVQTEQALTGYIHAERRFKLVPTEVDGFVMPSGTFVPAVGDKYAVFNIALPSEYLSNASQRMFEEAVKYFHQYQEPCFIFEGEVDPIWARKNWLNIGGKLIVGSHIRFSDPQFHPKGSVIRITAVKSQVGSPYQLELTLTNSSRGGSLANTLSKLEAEPLLAQEREQRTRQMVRRGWQEAMESQGMLQKALETLGEEFTKGISPITLQTMQVLVGSGATQYRFVTSKTAPAPATHLVTWHKEGAYLEVAKGIIQHRTLGIDTLTPKHRPSDYRYWDIPTYRSPALSHSSSSTYYLYSEVEREGEVGRFLLSEEPRPFEAGDKLNLLVGLLSSERDGLRSFAPMYGFSELTPDGLTTKLIRSADGNTYFDLEKGEIGGNITFRSGTLDDWAKGVQTEIDTINANPPRINANGNWEVYRIDQNGNGSYVDTGRPSAGDDAKSPIIVEKYWYEWDGTKYTNTGVKAVGTDGKDGNTFSISFYVEGEVRNGSLGVYYPNAHFFYNGVEISVEQVDASFRWKDHNKLYPNYADWASWGKFYGEQDEADLSDNYQGPGLEFEIKATYKGLTARATYFIPHIKDGKDGRSIERVTEEYALSNSDSIFPTSGWSSTPLTVSSSSRYLWNREVIHYSDKTTDTTSPRVIVTYVKDGTTGRDGKGIKTITNYYALSSSNSTPPTSGWSTTPKATTENSRYLWAYEVINFTDNTKTDTSKRVISTHGSKGRDGHKGDKGDGLDVKDTRSENQLPNWYRKNYRSTTVREFKYQSTMQIPATLQDGTYCVLETTVPCGDTSGGTIKQIVTLQNGTQITRAGSTDDNSWSEWQSLSAKLKAEAEARKQLEEAVNQQKYLARVIKEGKTDVEGGLVLSNVFAVRDLPHESTIITPAVPLGTMDFAGQDLEHGTKKCTYQLGTNQSTPPSGRWLETFPKPTKSQPVLWAKFHVGYPDDQYYFEEATLPVGFYYADNPLVSVIPQLKFSSNNEWHDVSWYDTNSIKGGRASAQAIVTYSKPVEGNVVGYMSGMGGGMPFIGAGVEHFRGTGGVPESRTVEIWQDGRFKFADLRYNPQAGELEFSKGSSPYMTLGGTPLSIDTLRQQAGESTQTLTSFTTQQPGKSRIPISTLTLAKDGGEIRISTKVSVTAVINEGSFRDDPRYSPPPIVSTSCAYLYLKHTSTSGETIDINLGNEVYASAIAPVRESSVGYDSEVDFHWETTEATTESVVEERIPNLKRGKYELYINLFREGQMSDCTSRVLVSDLVGTMYTFPNVDYIRYTERGLMAYYGIGKHFVIDKLDNEAFITAKGTTDLPGVLASGRCDAYGGINYQWGRYANAQGYSKARVEKLAYGKYKVHHTIGHTRYSPQVTVENVGSLVSATFTDIRDTYFIVFIYGTGGLRDAPFSYVCFGDNG